MFCHNVLESSNFCILILIVSNYDEFMKALDLVKNKSCYTVNYSQKLSVLLSEFFIRMKKEEKQVVKR